MTNSPWGWRATIHAYGTGPQPTDEQLFEAANLAADHIGANNYAGVTLTEIRDEPIEQGAEGPKPIGKIRDKRSA